VNFQLVFYRIVTTFRTDQMSSCSRYNLWVCTESGWQMVQLRLVHSGALW